MQEMTFDDLLVRARQEIWQANNILVTAHLRPDGDAIGSLLGLGLALEKAGKNVQMVLADGAPESLNFLEGFEKITKQWVDEVDLAIVLDSSDLSRIGLSLQDYGAPDINIDHHITNLNFARLNLVDPQATATAEILAANLPALGLELIPAVMNALMVGILTDTLGFRTNNLRPGTFHVVASLMEQGVNLPELYQRVFTHHSVNALRYWGAGLSGLHFDGRLAWVTLTLEDRKRAGYSGRDDADIINLLSAMRGADVALVFVEQVGGSVKISWRAQNGYDVSQLALQYGGGGHRAAAGAEIKGSLSEVQEVIVKATRKLLP